MANQGTPAQSKSITSFTESTKRPNEDSETSRQMRRKITEQTTNAPSTSKSTDTNKTPKPVIKDDNVPMFKALRKLTNKIEGVNHHLDLLTEFQKRGQAPRGLKTRVSPAVPDFPIDLYTKWEQAHTDFATNLTEILVTHWTRKHQQITEDITAAQITLDQNTEKKEYEYICELVEKCRVSKKEELIARREKKREKPDASKEDGNTNQEETS